MCDDEFAALVVDNDSGMCKTGLAGDDARRHHTIGKEIVLQYILISRFFFCN